MAKNESKKRGTYIVAPETLESDALSNVPQDRGGARGRGGPAPKSTLTYGRRGATW